jgi:hypothetical protein
LFFFDVAEASNQFDQTGSIFRERLVRITIQPAFAGLGGGDDRMPGCVGMFTGVTIWRAVTAQSNTARLTSAQMDPFAADLRAFFAFAAVRFFD